MLPPMFLRPLFRSRPRAMSSLPIMAWTDAGQPTGHHLVRRHAGPNNGSRNPRIAVEDDDGRLIRHLEESGASVGTSSPRLTVIVCDDFLGAHLAEVNRRQLEARAPWTLVRPHGMEALFGPIFRADKQGPCWDCLAYRLRGHQEVHNFLRNIAGEEAAFKPFATQPAVLEALYGLIAAEIVKWLVLDDAAPIHERAIAMNVGTFASSQHRVMRRPQCLACGDEAMHRTDRPPVPLCLKASPKAHRNSGGARTVAPEVTLAKYRHLVSPISGVVTWLSRTTDETDSWLHVYWAGANLGMRSRSLSSLRRSLRSKSAGKGSTREQSEVSALCEAVERYSGARCGDEIRIRKRFIEFAMGEEAIHPNDAQLFSDYQLDNAKSINAKGHPYNIVPARLDPDAAIDWTPVWSMTQQRHRYLPTSMLYSMPAEERGPADLIADSNGCAAGNTLEEAILQASMNWPSAMRSPSGGTTGCECRRSIFPALTTSTLQRHQTITPAASGICGCSTSPLISAFPRSLRSRVDRAPKPRTLFTALVPTPIRA